MATDPPPRINWRQWLRRWDHQQTRYLPHREERFTVMLDAVEASLPHRFRALDLGSGPGSLSQRLLLRFPQARSVAVDFDPVVLAIGRHALAPLSRRLTWVEADLRRSDWPQHLPPGTFDAALSSTALHWLTPAELKRTYRSVHRVLRPHGLFLNADHMPYAPRPTRIGRIARAAEALASARVRPPPGSETWETWWLRLEHEPGFAPLFEERQRRYGPPPGRRAGAHHGHPTALRDHLAYLRAAGFHETGVIWSEFANRVLLAVA